nr:MAG TPA: hypothetical protein [Caudoviricetes sp.]
MSLAEHRKLPEDKNIVFWDIWTELLIAVILTRKIESRRAP